MFYQKIKTTKRKIDWFLHNWWPRFRKWLNPIGLILIIWICLFASCLKWHNEDNLRFIGLVFQFIGMAVAITSLTNIGDHFKHPTLLRVIIQWFRDFPKWGEEVSTSHGTSAVIGESLVNAKATVWVDIKQDDPIDDKINYIIKNLDSLKEKQTSIEQEIDKIELRYNGLKKYVAEEIRKTKEELQSTQSTLKKIHIDDFVPAALGLFSLIIGITLSTMAPEISKLMG